MELIYRGSFLRDWDDCKSKELTKSLKIVIDKIKKAKTQEQIPRLKKLRTRSAWHKIEIQTRQGKVYWVLCIILRDKIEFVRVKSETYFKKNL